MPMARKSTRLRYRKYGLKKGAYSKYASKSRIYREPANVHHFKRSCELTPVNQAAAGQIVPVLFQMTQLPGYTDFSNLYDQFRVDKIYVRVVPQFNFALLQTSVAATPAIQPTDISEDILACIDYTAIGPTTQGGIEEYGNMKRFRNGKPAVLKYTPSILKSILGVNGSPIFQAAFKQWVDTAYIANCAFYASYWYLPDCVQIGGT
ncbi:unnamed protein product, partial [Rotaria socialis]